MRYAVDKCDLRRTHTRRMAHMVTLVHIKVQAWQVTRGHHVGEQWWRTDCKWTWGACWCRYFCSERLLCECHYRTGDSIKMQHAVTGRTLLCSSSECFWRPLQQYTRTRCVPQDYDRHLSVPVIYPLCFISANVLLYPEALYGVLSKSQWTS